MKTEYKGPSLDQPAFEQGMPQNIEAERLVLGGVLLDGSEFINIAGILKATDFSLQKHTVMFSRMEDIHKRGEKIDRISLADELHRHREIESVGGVGYIVSLDDNMPKIHNLESYARIVRSKSALRKIVMVASIVRDQAMAGEEDPDTIRQAAEEMLLDIGGNSSTERMTTPERFIASVGLNEFLSPDNKGRGCPTGLTRFDSMTGGLRGGELFILAARPAMGKTALAMNIGCHIALHSNIPKPVVVFSLEMSTESLLHRAACGIARVDMQKFRMGYINADERRRLQDATGQLMESPLHIDDSAGLTVMDMHSKLRKIRQRHGPIGLVIIDYLQLVISKGKASDNRTQEVSLLTRGLKILAKEIDAPIIALSQLSRAVEARADHRPQMSDLRESGSIEQDADVIAFVFREEYYKPDREDLRGQAELILAKQRNGPTGKIDLVFLKEYTKFENKVDQWDNQDNGQRTL